VRLPALPMCSRWFEDMTDFVLRRAGEVLTLYARTRRAKMRLARLPQAKSNPSTDRVLLKRDQAREVIDVLKFEGFGIEGQELI